jgi:nucleotide-binding universal stress UspA family protein
MFDKAVISSARGNDPYAAAEEAHRLKSLGVREVVLAHLVDVFDDSAESWREQEAAERGFQTQMSAFEDCDMRVHADVPLGHPSISLCETGQQHGARLFVVEAGSTALLGGGLPGDLTSDAFAASQTPVLVRPTRSPAAYCHCDVSNRILFATDFSQTAERAFSSVLEIVRSGGGQVDLLHVWDTDARGRMGELSEGDRRHTVHMGDLRRRLLDAGATEVSIEVVEGSPAEEISCRAGSGEYSLVVIGARGGSATTDGVLGDVSAPVVHDTATPILLVPPAPQEPQAAATARTASAARC